MSTLATEAEAEAQKADAPRPRPRLLAGRSPRDLLGRAAVHLLLAVSLVTVAFPVYYAIAGAFMGPSELSSYPTALVPHSVTGRNFSGAVDTIPLFRQYANSAITATAITVAQLFTSILAAYAFVFLPLKARAVVFGVFLATLMVPWEAIIIPNYLTLSDWGLGNTYFGLVLPFLASGFGTFMLRQAFRQLPGELRDAARIDGAGHWRFLWRIVVPLNKPALAALSIYVFLSARSEEHTSELQSLV